MYVFKFVVCIFRYSVGRNAQKLFAQNKTCYCNFNFIFNNLLIFVITFIFKRKNYYLYSFLCLKRTNMPPVFINIRSIYAYRFIFFFSKSSLLRSWNKKLLSKTFHKWILVKNANLFKKQQILYFKFNFKNCNLSLVQKKKKRKFKYSNRSNVCAIAFWQCNTGAKK